MGGRLDATNAVTPRLCVITPVSRDHLEHLGPDLAAIAAEKGGIIKPGVPVLVGRQEPAALAVLSERARQAGAPLLQLGRDFAVTAAADGSFSFRGLGVALDGLRPGLAGAHQQENMALALAAAALLRRQGLALGEAALRAGVEEVRWPGRLEWWGPERQLLLDGAHNEGGARALAAYLARLAPAGVRWVAGLKGVRNPADLLVPLQPHLTALYCAEPPVESPVPVAELQRAALALGLPAAAYASVAAALEAARAERRQGEIVLVAGSLFLVAAAREYLQQKEAVRP
jgi:dihydrofolate synthase/folylpolyglutamate synthase